MQQHLFRFNSKYQYSEVGGRLGRFVGGAPQGGGAHHARLPARLACSTDAARCPVLAACHCGQSGGAPRLSVVGLGRAAWLIVPKEPGDQGIWVQAIVEGSV